MTSHTSNASQARAATVITVDQARAQGVSARSLIDVALWNERGNDPRRHEQAAMLRRVAAQLAASNDNQRSERQAA